MPCGTVWFVAERRSITDRSPEARPVPNQHEVPVDCACNDDYGTTSDRVHSIHVPGLELSAIDMAGVHFREVRGFGFYVSRRKWWAKHLASNVGNLYWERYGMDGWSAAAFLHYLRKTKAWTPDGGYNELYEWWESGITADAHVRALLLDAAKDEPHP